MKINRFDMLISNLEEMTSAGVFTSPVSGTEEQPINGEFGNAVDPINNDFYATGDARTMAKPKKAKCVCKNKTCVCKKKKRS